MKDTYKLFHVEMAFVRRFEEAGTFPVAARDEAHAEEKVRKLFAKMDDHVITDVYPVDNCPQLSMLPQVPDEDEDEETPPKKVLN